MRKPQYVERALAMAQEVAAQQNADGSLPAYLSPQWTRRAEWTCVTGNSQMAINWLRLARETGESTFVDNARRANRFNMSVQDLTHADPALRGARGAAAKGNVEARFTYEAVSQALASACFAAAGRGQP